jgi:hypothetical protein
MRAYEIITEAKKDKPIKSRDPNWRDMEALRKSGAAGSHGDKTKVIPRKQKYKDSVTEAKQVGREFNHLEDLVFTNPDDGAKRAVQILKDMEQDASDVAIKWDGNPTVYWGRDEDGTFRMVGKNNWGREEGKSGSPEELEKFINSRGKGEDWREKFASDMAALWPIFEKATPADYRGYVYGDLLYHPGKPYAGSDGSISFTPNQTTYNVRAGSDIGRRIGKSKVAVAAHNTYEYFGDKSGTPIDNVKQFNGTGDLVVLGQQYVSKSPAVNADNLGNIEKVANKAQGDIKKFFTPQKGLSDLADIFYTYINQMSRAKKLEDLNLNSFLNWLQNSKVSANKQEKILNIAKEQEQVMKDIFYLVTELMKAKNEVIDELDKAEGDVVATTGGKPGGEGYVKTKDKVKLVPRDRWTPFRSD